MSNEGTNKSEVAGPGESSERTGHTFTDPESAKGRLQIDHELGKPPRPENLSSEAVDSRVAEVAADEAEDNGHALKRHVHVTEKQLERRASDGVEPDHTDAEGKNKPGENPTPPNWIPRHSTMFKSEAAFVAAEQTAWNSKTAEREALEAGYRQKLENDKLEKLGVEVDRTGDITEDDMVLVAEVPAADALGPDWRDHVYGRTKTSGGQSESVFPDDTQIKAIWRLDDNGAWYVDTCYAHIPPDKKGKK